MAKFGCVTPNLFPICIALRGNLFFAVCTLRNKREAQLLVNSLCIVIRIFR